MLFGEIFWHTSKYNGYKDFSPSVTLPVVMRLIDSTSKHHPLHKRRRSIDVPLGTQRFLAAFEGIEGGFAIGASIIVALAIAGLDRDILLATAIVSIVVNGYNSSSVKYSSEHYLDELDGREKKSAFKHYFIPALIEFACYLLLSFISVLPLLFVPDPLAAALFSVTITLFVLFIAGIWRGFMLHTNGIRDGIETAVLGIGIIGVGVISGLVVNSL
ncbi:MAG: hypothetical protein QG649_314 [Patescibacteria group bacterium]|nr:hypothetical protein [Patescibacteria group bacterium]